MDERAENARRLAAAMAELTAAGIKPAAANPPLNKLLAILGIKTLPPHYASFSANALIYGLFFGITWGLLMYLLIWRSQQMPLVAVAIAMVAAGVLFGSMMAAMWAWQRKRKQLSKWEDL